MGVACRPRKAREGTWSVGRKPGPIFIVGVGATGMWPALPLSEHVHVVIVVSVSSVAVLLANEFDRSIPLQGIEVGNSLRH